MFDKGVFSTHRKCFFFNVEQSVIKSLVMYTQTRCVAQMNQTESSESVMAVLDSLEEVYRLA